MQLTPQFVVWPDAIRLVVPGNKHVSSIAWNQIDVNALGKEEPQIDSAREKAMLTRKPTYFTILPPPNYYRLFLDAPVNIRFNRSYSVTAVSNSRYYVSLQGFSQRLPDGGSFLSAQGFANGTTTTSIRIVDTTRYPLATTMGGVLGYMCDARSIESQRVIRALQDHGYFFPNLLAGLQNLAKVRPNDRMIPIGIAAVERLGYERAVHFDSQVRLGNFLTWAQQQAGR